MIGVYNGVTFSHHQVEELFFIPRKSSNKGSLLLHFLQCMEVYGRVRECLQKIHKIVKSYKIWFEFCKMHVN